MPLGRLTSGIAPFDPRRTAPRPGLPGLGAPRTGLGAQLRSAADQALVQMRQRMAAQRAGAPGPGVPGAPGAEVPAPMPGAMPPAGLAGPARPGLPGMPGAMPSALAGMPPGGIPGVAAGPMGVPMGAPMGMPMAAAARPSISDILQQAARSLPPQVQQGLRQLTLGEQPRGAVPGLPSGPRPVPGAARPGAIPGLGQALGGTRPRVFRM